MNEDLVPGSPHFIIYKQCVHFQRQVSSLTTCEGRAILALVELRSREQAHAPTRHPPVTELESDSLGCVESFQGGDQCSVVYFIVFFLELIQIFGAVDRL